MRAEKDTSDQTPADLKAIARAVDKRERRKVRNRRNFEAAALGQDRSTTVAQRKGGT